MRNLAHHLTVLGVNATCAATVQAVRNLERYTDDLIKVLTRD